tara:strand:- start:2830 stop:3219 length:390 start_codon:yes stop_codon:yes gene_type:complete
LYRLVYHSKPFGFDTSVLNGLLIDSRENNQKNSITGSLVCRADIYLQMLEGPEEKVLKTFNKIKADDRHLEIEVLFTDENIKTRLFPDWAMKDDPVKSWMWSQKEVAEGAVRKSTELEIMNIFKKIAAI